MLAMFPHMHLRGKSFRYTAFYPDGSARCCSTCRIRLQLAECVCLPRAQAMPAGTKLVLHGHFDNSEENLANPDPTATVRWGDQTWEEMMIGYFDMVLAGFDDQDRPGRAKPTGRSPGPFPGCWPRPAIHAAGVLLQPARPPTIRRSAGDAQLLEQRERRLPDRGSPTADRDRPPCNRAGPVTSFGTTARPISLSRMTRSLWRRLWIRPVTAASRLPTCWRSCSSSAISKLPP
jgi:hypothetical protein